MLHDTPKKCILMKNINGMSKIKNHHLMPLFQLPYVDGITLTILCLKKFPHGSPLGNKPLIITFLKKILTLQNMVNQSKTTFFLWGCITFQDTLVLTYEQSLELKRKFLITFSTCDRVKREYNQANKMYHMETNNT